MQVTTDTGASTDENQVCQRIYCVPEIENNQSILNIRSILEYPSIAKRQKKD